VFKRGNLESFLTLAVRDKIESLSQKVSEHREREREKEGGRKKESEKENKKKRKERTMGGFAR